MKGAASIGLLFHIDPMLVLRSDQYDAMLYAAMGVAGARMLAAARDRSSEA